ncbi:MAG: zinc-binding dehydrogenase, partial [Planctomycetota bacterium]
PLANDIDPIQTAPLACAGLTAFETVKKLRSNDNKTLLIMGVGGVGHLAIQYAKESFTRIIAIDPSAIRIAQAKLLGAETYSPEEWLSLNSKPLVDAAAVFAADPSAVTGAMKALRNGGTLALVGLGKHKELSLPWFELVTRGIRILGSHVGPISTLKEVVEYHHLGKANVLVETKPLADIRIAMAELAAGKNNSPRLVLVP